MPDVEDLAVNAVKELIAYCPRLDAEINDNDKTPITDGHIDLYEGPGRSKNDLIGRVAVQVKGRTHHNKKIFKKSSTSFPVALADLKFLRDNRGGIYFYVAVHPESRQRRVFSATLNPFKLDRLIKGMKPGQQGTNIVLHELSEDINRIERIVEFAWNTSNQDVRLGSNGRLLDENSKFTIYSSNGIDLSRPATLELTKTDFAVVVHTSDGLNIPVDVDLEIYPAGYLEHEAHIQVSCGEVNFSKVRARQLDEHSIEMSLAPTLRLTLYGAEHRLSISVDLSQESSVPEQLHVLDFFIAASGGAAISIGEQSHNPDSPPDGPSPDLLKRRAQVAELGELLDRLDIDQTLIDVSQIDDAQQKMLSLMHRALVRGEDLHASDGAAGRFDVAIGQSRATLMAVPASTDGFWRFFDIFDAANRSMFRLYTMVEDGEPKEILGTAYEGLQPEELATTLNLRLETIAQAYEAVEDRDVARGLANPKILQLIHAADNPSTIQRDKLLTAAQNLNEWLISQQGPDPIHLINRWQVMRRQGTLSDSDHDEIRGVRRAALKSNAENADLIDACCAILLGDEPDVRHSVAELTREARTNLETWPIWRLTESRDDGSTESTPAGVTLVMPPEHVQ